MHLPPAFQPLVRQDRDEDQQGHALVLLGRRGRSRRLPRDQTVAVANHPANQTSPSHKRAGPRRFATLTLLMLGGYGLLAYLVLPGLCTHYEHQRGLENLPMVTRTAQGIPG